MDFWIGVIGTGVLVILLLSGVHIAIALGITGFLGVVAMSGVVPGASLLATSFYYKIANYSLITIPLFVLMGLLAAGGGVSNQLYDAAAIWMGKLRAGLGIATVAACTLFGTVCGSSLVTASVFAKVSGPHMRSHGYAKRLAYGICASAGMIGMLIPPSVLAVVYAFADTISGAPGNGLFFPHPVSSWKNYIGISGCRIHEAVHIDEKIHSFHGTDLVV